MDSEILREACRRAGLRVYSENASRPWMVEIPDWGGLHIQHPAVESYVADLLVGMVRERNAPVFGRFCAAVAALIDEVGDPQDPEVGFTYTQLEGFLYYIDKKHIITAAMEVLDD